MVATSEPMSRSPTAQGAESRPHALLVTEQIKPGGKRSHVVALYAGLEAIGWDVSLLDSNDFTPIERAWVALPGLLLNRLQPALSARWFWPRTAAQLVHRAQKLRDRVGNLEVVNLQEPIMVAAARRALPGVPIALTVHGPAHRELASGYEVPLENPTVRWVRTIEERAFHEADAVISVDQAHAAYVREFGRTDRIWVIPNFVDTRQFNTEVRAGSFSPEIERWVAERPVVLCPRLLVPKNGVHVAIEAAARLRDARLPFVLIVLGHGPQRRDLEAQVRALSLENFVSLPGAMTQARMPGCIRRAAAVIVPSVPSKGVEEATSIAALEGQACGRPVIASALGGLREIIEDGVTGLLVPAGRADSLADAIGRVLSDADLAARLGGAGAAHVRDHHSHVSAARRYADVYRAIGTRA